MTQTKGGATTAPPPKPSARTRGPFARISRFVREVISELTKVIWPSRKDLITYTTVVLVFVSIMVALVFGLDVGFAKAVVAVFG